MGRQRQEWDGKEQYRIGRDRVVDGKDRIGDGRDRNGTGKCSAEKVETV